MAYLIEICALALVSLRGQSLRTLLNVTGIAIGIAAFTVTASINQGGRDMVFSELQTFGLRSVWIERDYPMLNLDGEQMASGTGIDNGDLNGVEGGCCPAVAVASPIVFMSSQLVKVRSNTSDSQLIGVGRHYPKINNDTVVAGRRINEEDERQARQVILIGSRTREDLFGNRKAVVGEMVRIGGRMYRVIGVLAEKKRDFLNSVGIGKGDDPNRRILLPYTVAQRLESQGTAINTLQLETVGAQDADAAKAQVERVLRRNHGGKYAYRAENMQQYVEAAERIVRSVSLVGLIASAMSLFVGGVGVANVMAMTVLERTREIGLRKAIGATRGAVLMQFSVEAMAIGVIGGLIGIALSYGAIAIAQQFTRLAVEPTAAVLASAVLVAGGVGGIAGLYPSWVAANMKPTSALRS